MKIILRICRIIVGALFIVSGIIKANDPLGFSYKLEEYFAESALNLTHLIPFALALAILVCLVEVILGFAILFGAKSKLSTWAVLLLTLFFGWLTFYTATCDPNATFQAMENGVEVTKTVTCVTSCGCFGDALKGSIGRTLTPWESFSKDIVLLIFILPLFFFRKKIPLNTFAEDKVLLPLGLLVAAAFCWVFSWWFPILFILIGYFGYLIIKYFFKKKAEWPVAAYIILITSIFIWYGLTYLPVRDYRPYHIGVNIEQAMELPADAKPYIYKTSFSYKNLKTGKVKDFNEDNYPWKDTLNWKFVNSNSELVQKGDDPAISDFSLIDSNGNNQMSDFLQQDGYLFIVVAKTVDNFNTDVIEKINNFSREAKHSDAKIIGLTASSMKAASEFRTKNEIPFDFYYGDGTTIKTIIRANPGILLLKHGTIIGKWSGDGLPKFKEIENKLLH